MPAGRRSKVTAGPSHRSPLRRSLRAAGDFRIAARAIHPGCGAAHRRARQAARTYIRLPLLVLAVPRLNSPRATRGRGEGIELFAPQRPCWIRSTYRRVPARVATCRRWGSPPGDPARHPRGPFRADRQHALGQGRRGQRLGSVHRGGTGRLGPGCSAREKWSRDTPIRTARTPSPCAGSSREDPSICFERCRANAVGQSGISARRHTDARFTLAVYTKAVKRRVKLSGPYLAEFDRALEWAELPKAELAERPTGKRQKLAESSTQGADANLR